MRIIQFIRSLTGLIMLPVLTLTASFLAIFQGGVLRSIPQNLQWIPRYWGQLLLWINGVKVELHGLENIVPGKPYIYAANHQSQFDIFTLQGYLPYDFRWMAKKELFQLPFFGWGMRLAGYIPVDRSGGRKALKSLEEAAKRIASGTSVIIFPEGTRSRDGEIHPFKAGAMVLAIKSKVPLVPVAISGTFAVLPKGKFLAKPGRVVVRFGVPIKTEGYTTKQKQELAEKLHIEVVKLKQQTAAEIS